MATLTLCFLSTPGLSSETCLLLRASTRFRLRAFFLRQQQAAHAGGPTFVPFNAPGEAPTPAAQAVPPSASDAQFFSFSLPVEHIKPADTRAKAMKQMATAGLAKAPVKQLGEVKVGSSAVGEPSPVQGAAGTVGWVTVQKRKGGSRSRSRRRRRASSSSSERQRAAHHRSQGEAAASLLGSMKIEFKAPAEASAKAGADEPKVPRRQNDVMAQFEEQRRLASQALQTKDTGVKQFSVQELLQARGPTTEEVKPKSSVMAKAKSTATPTGSALPKGLEHLTQMLKQQDQPKAPPSFGKAGTGAKGGMGKGLQQFQQQPAAAQPWQGAYGGASDGGWNGGWNATQGDSAGYSQQYPSSMPGSVDRRWSGASGPVPPGAVSTSAKPSTAWGGAMAGKGAKSW
eukprot:TRINITY_DN33330_c0_g6_i1.p1 TRINITY_DN33330_c0_g6~~TRINITY_DN33330_c0_g6_i1.p1  ORF type:complete len:400 (-),score=101.55 TRINITY_DN33330_c0_g6_i1:316-1515(-)